MNKGFRILIISFLVFSIKQLSAQDLHFSQYFNAPLLVNPANTGFDPVYDYRVGGNYRNQWSSVSNYPYKTMSIWGDAQIFANRFDDGWMGIGGAFLQDVAGSGNLTSTKAYASIAYHQILGLNSLLSGGFNLGFTQKRIDVNKLSFNSQWNGKFFDANIVTGEPFAYSAVSYFTVQAGINYSYFASDNIYLNVGLSVSNINRPNETFFATSTADNSVNERYTAFANASFKIQDTWILNPNVYFSKMSSASEVVVGMMAQRDLSAEHNGSLQLLAGAYYRFNDAIIPNIGFDIKNVKFTFSYDATSSTLKNYNQTLGAYEVSIVKRGLYKGKEKNIKCPAVHF